MTTRKAFTGLALAASTMLTGTLEARVYNLPDVAVASPGTVNTELIVSEGTAQAAINLSIDYNSTVAEPGTVTAGGGAAGYTVAQNVLDLGGGNKQLRIVLYHTTTREFAAGRSAVLVIPWTVPGGLPAGQFTNLNITNIAVSDINGVSGVTPEGLAGAPNGVGGRIVVSTFPGPTGGDFTAEDLTQWTSFQSLPFPLNEGSAPPFMNVPPNGTTPLSVATTADNSRDGVAGWGSGNARVPYQANSIYQINWTFQGIVAPTQSHVNTFRFRALDDAFNSQMEMAVSPFSIGSLNAAGLVDAPRVYELFYEPSDLSANQAAGFEEFNDIQFTFDVVDFEPTLAGEIRLTNFEVTRFDKAQVDPNFLTRYQVTDFTNAGQWVLGFDSSTVTPDPATGAVPLAALNYNPQPGFVEAGTSLDDPDGAGPQIGSFQEFGMPPNVLSNQDNVVWRERVSAETPAGHTPNSNATIRMRFTDETQTMSSLYSVFSVGGRNRGPSTGSNRPRATGDPAGLISYFNYFTYPNNSNVQSLLEGGSESMLGILSLLDLENNIGGNVRFSNFAIESAPREVFQLP